MTRRISVVALIVVGSLLGATAAQAQNFQFLAYYQRNGGPICGIWSQKQNDTDWRNNGRPGASCSDHTNSWLNEAFNENPDNVNLYRDINWGGGRLACVHRGEFENSTAANANAVSSHKWVNDC